MKPVWLALGSNLGDREAHLRRAIQELQSPALRILRVSPVYETAPQGYLEQDWFLNLVLAAETSLMPLQLLGQCHRVERQLKRKRSIVNGPRTIDIDVLFYGNAIVNTRSLQIPHPRYRERRFVLQPLADLDAEFRDPTNGRLVKQMLANVSDQLIRPTGIVIAVEPASSWL